MSSSEGELLTALLNEFLQSTMLLARSAGQAIMRVYETADPSVHRKSDGSLLTEADLASHEIITNGLRSLKPGYPVLSEESAEVPRNERATWRRFWLVDPLDGTKEFVCRNGEFTVNIALIDGDEPILGIVFAPAMNTMYFAARGIGAFKDDGERRVELHARRPSGEKKRLIVSRSHSETIDQWKKRFGDCEIVPIGSSIKFCLIAEGAADLYPRFGPTMEWDTAAAQCIVEVAGGSVIDAEGSRLRYNKPDLRNPSFTVKTSTAGAVLPPLHEIARPN